MNIFLIILAFIMSTTIAKFFYRHAEKLGFVAYPNHRSSHITPTFTGGGCSFVITFLSLSYFLFPNKDLWFFLSVAIFILAMVSIIDDRKHVSPLLRFSCQGIAVSILYFCFYAYFQSHNIALSLFFIVSSMWFINLFNFMDGIDTIACMEAMSVLLCAVIQMVFFSTDYSMIPMFLLTVAAIAGFLIWNLPPAKLFMGDIGSICLAFFILFLALFSIVSSTLTISSWLILLAMFWLDATITLVKRVIKREKLHHAHCSHIYQQWAKRCKNHLKVSVSYMMINFVWLFPISCLSLYFPQYCIYWVTLAIFPISMFMILK